MAVAIQTQMTIEERIDRLTAPTAPSSACIQTQMTIEERIDSYKQLGYPNGLFVAADGRLIGMWIMGNNYRVKSSYYGGYPHGYLKRIKSLFPDKRSVLHLFSGMVDTDTMPGDTVDMLPELNPTYVDDAQTLDKVPVREYDLILADPPYSVEDAKHYGTPMISRNKVMKALGNKAISGTHVVWLDQVLPMYRKAEWDLVGLIGMVKSTNHRYRLITIFERK